MDFFSSPTSAAAMGQESGQDDPPWHSLSGCAAFSLAAVLSLSLSAALSLSLSLSPCAHALSPPCPSFVWQRLREPQLPAHFAGSCSGFLGHGACSIFYNLLSPFIPYPYRPGVSPSRARTASTLSAPCGSRTLRFNHLHSNRFRACKSLALTYECPVPSPFHHARDPFHEVNPPQPPLPLSLLLQCHTVPSAFRQAISSPLRCIDSSYFAIVPSPLRFATL